MIVIYYRVYAPRGEYEVKDYITETMAWKLKRLAKAIGAEASFLKYEFFAKDYVGRNLTLVLKVEESDEYGDQNRVKAYKPFIGTVPAASAPMSARPQQVDESIPF